MAKQSESNKKIDFEKAEERLEEIVDKLGSDDVSLDESLKLFEEGVSLVKECNKILEKAERKIKIIENGKEDPEDD